MDKTGGGVFSCPCGAHMIVKGREVKGMGEGTDGERLKAGKGREVKGGGAEGRQEQGRGGRQGRERAEVAGVKAGKEGERGVGSTCRSCSMDWPTSLSISALSVKSWFSRRTGWRRSMPGSLSMRYKSSAACTGGQNPCKAQRLALQQLGRSANRLNWTCSVKQGLNFRKMIGYLEDGDVRCRS